MPPRPTCPQEAPCGLCPGCTDDTLQRAAREAFATPAASAVDLHVPGLHEVEAVSGRYVDLLAPDPTTIVLEDVAHALARLCRYTGHVQAEHYSVAEHAVLVADRLAATGADLPTCLAGLHHDDTEAYLGDVARPLKQLLPTYAVLERRMHDAVFVAFGLPAAEIVDWHAVKAADNWALACEAFHLLPSQGAGWQCDGLFLPDDAGARPVGLSAVPASALWRSTHRRLLTLLDRFGAEATA
jgi:hypothetical protein